MIKQIIQHSAEEALKAVSLLLNPETQQFIESVSQEIATCFQSGGKLLIAGNGGSLCDASHFAEELTGVFRHLRSALPAIVLNEAGHLTCTANDLGYEFVFSRGIEAFGKPGDLFIGLTTSGNSANMVRAFETAKEKQLKTIAFLGKTGGILAGKADIEWIVSGFKYSDRIQEAHMASMHIIIEAVEHLLFHSVKTTYKTCCSIS